MKPYRLERIAYQKKVLGFAKYLPFVSIAYSFGIIQIIIMNSPKANSHYLVENTIASSHICQKSTACKCHQSYAQKQARLTLDKVFMQHYLEILFSYIEGLEIKISCAAFAAYLSYHFGGNAYLLLLVQYLFIADFAVGVIDATKAKKFSWSKVWFGIKKVISLYFGVLVVGFGTKAFDIAIHGRIEIEYNGTFFFDLFIYLLIVFELASINRHLAHLDFSVNKLLEAFFEKITTKLKVKINTLLDVAVDKSFENLGKYAERPDRRKPINKDKD